MKKALSIFIFLLCSIHLFSQSSITTSETPERSGGSYGPQKLPAETILGPHIGGDVIPLTVSSSFNGFNFDDNATENSGFRFIPPDPCGAAGTDRIIAVVNTMIECRTKAGALLWRDGLSGFFSALGPPLGTYTFDPKVVWDHFENRFVVVTLERNDVTNTPPDASDESHILVAVSKTATPATATSADWWFHDINSKITITNPCWADYPGFEVDEEAVYITNNMFSFGTYGGGYEGTRLWIIDKGVSGGFYAGAAALWKVLDPYAGGGTEVTTQPALVYGASGPGAGIGTYLLGYSGLTDNIDEYVQVVRVNNPLPIAPDGTTFTQTYVNVGHIEDHAWPTLPDGPQLGTTAMDIEVNDRRALDAVWRDDANRADPMLWLTTTIYPDVTYDAANTGETTAHWFRLNTSTWPPTLDDQGNIGGDDISGAGTAVFTFFPALAVDSQGNANFGFAATSDLMYGGAYAVGQEWSDPASTVRVTETIAAGVGEYQRTFGQPRNRWGDYSGAALDPVTENVWIFNQYAMAPGSGTSPEDGRWGTAWGTGESPLPVELGSYTADVSHEGVILNWTTESEIENLGFIIERRIEGGDWIEIVSYKTDATLGGQGTTSSFTDYEYIDHQVEKGNTYDYRLIDVDYNGVINYNAVRSITVNLSQIRSEGDPLILLDAYPNPFNPVTSLHYSISENRNVIIEIYDITGQLVNTLVDKKQSAGWHNIQWNGTNRSGKIVPAGIYIGKVTAGNNIKTAKLMLLK